MLAQRGVGLEVGRGHWIVAPLGADLVTAVAEVAAQDRARFQSACARVLEFARQLSARRPPRHMPLARAHDSPRRRRLRRTRS